MKRLFIAVFCGGLLLGAVSLARADTYTETWTAAGYYNVTTQHVPAAAAAFCLGPSMWYVAGTVASQPAAYYREFWVASSWQEAQPLPVALANGNTAVNDTRSYNYAPSEQVNRSSVLNGSPATVQSALDAFAVSDPTAVDALCQNKNGIRGGTDNGGVMVRGTGLYGAMSASYQYDWVSEGADWIANKTSGARVVPVEWTVRGYLHR